MTTRSSTTGSTLGVEEEFHLVDPETFALAPRTELAAEVSLGTADHHLRAEMLTSQLEAVTDVCHTLDEVRAEIIAARTAAAAAAARHGAVILGTSTHPFATLSEVEIMGHPRYERLITRFGAVPNQFNLCGCHVHVSVPDLDTAVQVLSHARPYLPLMLALSGSSPFHEAVDTHHASWRTSLLALWPQGGTPPRVGTEEEYCALVADLQRTELIDDASNLLWEVRPSVRYPTIEFRAPDVCTRVDDAVLLAGLARSLTRTLAARATVGQPAPDPPVPLLAAAKWRAGRYGLDGPLWSFARGELVDGSDAVLELFAELRPDLEQHGEYETIAELGAALLSRGTSAMRQRRTAARCGNLRDVVADAVALTAAS